MVKDDIIIRFATLADADRIMEAIKDHWDSNHILALNKEFFLYIFTGDKNNLNFVIAEDKSTYEIAGFLGYIRYTSSLPCGISLVMWQALEEKGGFLGLKMLLFLTNQKSFDFIFSVGINPKTARPIYQFLRFHTGKLDHYYRIMDKKSYMIAEIENKIILPVLSSEFEISLVENISSFYKAFDTVSSSVKKVFPLKDIDYFRHRFFEHPIYSYKIFFIYSKYTKGSKSFFVCREVEQFETKILRIVDFIGDEVYFAGIARALQNLIDQNNYEYIDCYSYGISEETMNRAGLVKRIEDDNNIIPTYFEPFVRANIDIYFFAKQLSNVRLFRADADQDQPRLNSGVT
jgi:hypothetical protein